MTRSGRLSGMAVYLDCELCGRAFSPRRARPGNPERTIRCPACARQERDLAADARSASSLRQRALDRKMRESMNAVARRLKG